MFFILLLDYLVPLGVAMGFLYFFPIMFSAYIIKEVKFIKYAALISSVFIIIGYYISSPLASGPLVIANRFLSLIAIGFCSLFSIWLVQLISEVGKLEKLSTVALKASPGGMLMTDSEGKINLTNNEVENIFGYSENELYEKVITDLIPSKAQSDESMNLFESFQEVDSRDKRELIGKKKNGEMINIEMGLTLVQSLEGLFAVISLVDITERKKLENKLKRSNEELAQFAYRTSHDLKSPLVTIMSLTNFISEDLESGEIEEVKKNIKKVRNHAERLKYLVVDILNLTRADQEEQTYKFVDLFDVINHLRDSYQEVLEEKSVDFEFDVQGSSTIKTQKIRLEQILVNLLLNGIKYSDVTKKKRFVKFSFNSLGERVVIRVNS